MIWNSEWYVPLDQRTSTASVWSYGRSSGGHYQDQQAWYERLEDLGAGQSTHYVVHF
jgi:hypothetical protein